MAPPERAALMHLTAELARASGIGHYRVVPALNNHPRLTAALTALAREGLARV